MGDKAKGKAKEAAGAITGDEKKKEEGQAQQQAGEAKQDEKVRQEKAKANASKGGGSTNPVGGLVDGLTGKK